MAEYISSSQDTWTRALGFHSGLSTGLGSDHPTSKASTSHKLPGSNFTSLFDAGTKRLGTPPNQGLQHHPEGGSEQGSGEQTPGTAQPALLGCDCNRRPASSVAYLGVLRGVNRTGHGNSQTRASPGKTSTLAVTIISLETRKQRSRKAMSLRR